MTDCPRCQAVPAGALPLCLACGHGAEGPRRSLRLVEVSEIEERAQGKLIAALRALEARPSALIEPTVERGSFRLRVLSSDVEQARLDSALEALGARFRASTSAVSDERYEVSWSLDAVLGLKLCFAAATIVAAQLFDVPSVTTISVPAFGVLALRAGRVMPQALSCAGNASGRYLGLVNDDLITQLAAALPALRARKRVEALRSPLARFAGLAGLLRANGALLLRPELVRIDHFLHELMRQVLRTAAPADTCDDEGEAFANLVLGVDQRLGAIMEMLEVQGRGKLGPSLSTAPISMLAELQKEIEKTLAETDPGKAEKT